MNPNLPQNGMSCSWPSVTTTDENGVRLLWSCPHEVVTCSGVSNPLMSLTLDAFRNNGL